MNQKNIIDLKDVEAEVLLECFGNICKELTKKVKNITNRKA